MTDGSELWHVVEARREDGAPTLFRIRELEPRADQPTIFVAELPYATSAMSRMPDAAAYRRLAEFEEHWLAPACAALDWTFVATKLADGSCFYYLYGAGEPRALSDQLAGFDPALAFFNEPDSVWAEYAALHDLLAEASVPLTEDTVLSRPTPPKPKGPGAAKARAKRAARYRPK